LATHAVEVAIEARVAPFTRGHGGEGDGLLPLRSASRGRLRPSSSKKRWAALPGELCSELAASGEYNALARARALSLKKRQHVTVARARVPAAGPAGPGLPAARRG